MSAQCYEYEERIFVSPNQPTVAYGFCIVQASDKIGFAAFGTKLEREEFAKRVASHFKNDSKLLPVVSMLCLHDDSCFAWATQLFRYVLSDDEYTPDLDTIQSLLYPKN